MKKTSLKLLGTALTTALLASCGGESSNLADPERPIVSTCTADTCVSGIFVADGVVEGLNYECGNIRSKTNYQGEFSCPLEKAASKVTFLISHADTGNKVTLGEYTFRPVFTTTYDANSSPVSSYEAVPSLIPDKRVYVTPRDLTGEQFSDGFSDRALSITALLHSLDTDFAPTVPAETGDMTLSPASIVNLSEANKLTFLKGLPEKTAGEPRVVSSVDTDFLGVVNPGLEAISASRKIRANLQAYRPIAQQATHSIAAGIYKANEPSYLFTGLAVGFKTLDEVTSPDLASINVYSRLPFAGKTTSAGTAGGCTASGCNTFFGYMNFGVDRSGRLFGFGTTEMRLNGSLLTDPLALSPALSQTWPNSGDLKDMRLLLMNSDRTTRTETIVMTQGVVDQGSMAASSEMYKDYFGADASVDARLGRWELKSGNTVLMGASSDTLPPRMELRHGYNAFPILNPDVWNSIASFPLHFKAVITEGCTTAPCNKVEVNFSVLADGNIISDKDKNCAAVNSVTLIDSASTQELPIGVITRAFANDGAGATGGKYLIPLILLPSELVSSTETRQIEIGTGAAARLRVDNNDFGIYSNASAATDGTLTWSDIYILNKTFVEDTTALDPKTGGTITTSKAACMP